jgi:2-hydroxychromene-2-carboxylate isomerase
MATIIDFQAARRRRSGPTFAFDLASPWTYLAADTVTAEIGPIRWVAALAAKDEPRRIGAGQRAKVERTAVQLGLRFEFPATGLPDGTAAARAAAFAQEHGRVKEFALAASRLTWGWGADLDDHGTIARAAGIAELPLDAILEATFDPRRDDQLRAEAHEGAPALLTAGFTLDGPALAQARGAGEQLRRAR